MSVWCELITTQQNEELEPARPNESYWTEHSVLKYKSYNICSVHAKDYSYFFQPAKTIQLSRKGLSEVYVSPEAKEFSFFPSFIEGDFWRKYLGHNFISTSNHRA